MQCSFFFFYRVLASLNATERKAPLLVRPPVRDNVVRREGGVFGSDVDGTVERSPPKLPYVSADQDRYRETSNCGREGFALGGGRKAPSESQREREWKVGPCRSGFSGREGKGRAEIDRSMRAGYGRGMDGYDGFQTFCSPSISRPGSLLYLSLAFRGRTTDRDRRQLKNRRYST